MKKRLFLTGDQGCGKSTLIRNCLGGRLQTAGGFLTVRTGDGVELRDPQGKAEPVLFLELSQMPVFHGQLFSDRLRSLLLRKAAFAAADEIGGIELLLPQTREIWEDFFAAGIPCIGVVKNPSSAEKLSRRLRLGSEYLQAAENFRQWLLQDPDTMVIPMDARAEALTAQWAQEYAHD